MKMRTFGRLVFLIPLLFAVPASVAHADEIFVGDHISFERGEGQAGGGGFIATLNNTPEDTFLTFCLQARTPMEFGEMYTVGGLSTYAETDEPIFGGNAVGHDDLSSQTAWLYTQLRLGTLDGWDNSMTANDAFQWAVWTLEDEFPEVQPDMYWTDLANHFINLANQAVQNGFTGLGNVRVINLVSLDGQDAQDQLAYVTTPEPPTIALLVCGLFGLGVTRRRWLAATTR
jgi:hypothetical protein